MTSNIVGLGHSRKIYLEIINSIKKKNFIYYVREIEFCYNVRKKKAEKIHDLLSILGFCKDTCKMIFYEKDFLIDIDKEFYTDSSSDSEESEDDSDDN